MPTPTPTEAQIDKVREIAGENSYSYVEDLIEVLNDSQWARALELITSWAEYPAGDSVELQGGREGVRFDPDDSRFDIRVRMRLLLGLPELQDSAITGAAGSRAIRTTWIW